MEPFDTGEKIRVCRLRKKYPLTIDYDRKFEVLVADGGYNDIHPSVVPVSFWETSDPRIERVEVYPFAISQPTETAALLQLMREKKLVPLDIRGLLTFGVEYHEVQWECPLVALGSRWKNREGDEGVAFLWHNPFGRTLSLALIREDRPWLPTCRFLAVRSS